MIVDDSRILSAEAPPYYNVLFTTGCDSSWTKLGNAVQLIRIKKTVSVELIDFCMIQDDAD